ncbi:SCP2 sterol-binding domain-containing protein [Pontibacterium granulatum]|uniref:ubiquinone biosynthesis accessory factor UbiJ n=1 Tax=Pontibacterium granulatum TaxID=2036029 RepID=UPI00249CA459|nr:SCP2 sterol-binding domain-containing protein [Pontibacterium granulatum]MDI3324679.1 SCP2 sterol-binding domain-containing protein [Pontibacterium granulatum]
MIELLNATAFTVAEETVNTLLQRDPVTLGHLERLSGKVIAIELSLPAICIYILPNATGLQLQSHIEDDADVVLNGSPADFIKLLTSKDAADAMFGKGITVTGDSGLATRFQEIMADTRIDWEGALGDIVGDLPAHQLANFFNWKVDSTKRTGSSFIHNLEEYLTEEARMLPTRPEVDNFLRNVDQIRDSVDRLEARIQQLQHKLHA